MNRRNPSKKLTKLTQAQIRKNKNMRGVDLSYCDLSGLDFSDVDLTGANLSYSRLTNAKFTRAILVEVNLSHADCSGDDLCQPHLVASSLLFDDAGIIDDDLFKWNFGAIFDYANLTRANCFHTNFSNCHMKNVNFDSVILAGAHFKGAFLTGCNVRDVRVNSKTEFGEARTCLTPKQNRALTQSYQDYYEDQLNRKLFSELVKKNSLLLKMRHDVLPAELINSISMTLYELHGQQVETRLKRISDNLFMLDDILNRDEIFGEECKACLPVIIRMKQMLSHAWFCDLQKWTTIQSLSMRPALGLFEPETNAIVDALLKAIRDDRLEGFKCHFDTICEDASKLSVRACSIQ